ncbi:MAG: hypothetical protein AABY95_02485 [Pseudomonadota bacterium]
MKRLTLLLLAMGFAAAVDAAVPAPPDEKALKLDQTIQGVKYEALLLTRDLFDLEDSILFPQETRTNIFTSVTVPGFLISRMTVSVDGGNPVVYAYSESESKALLKDGFHRISHTNLDPGPHRIRADFIGKFYDAKPEEAPLTGNLETVFNKGLTELNLILPIARNSRLDKPGINEVARLDATGRRAARGVWLPEAESVISQADTFVPGSEADPHYRLALFLRHDKRFFSALTELMRIAAGLREDATLPDEFYQLLAECYLGFAMETRAEDYFRQLVENAPDPDKFNNARIELAEFNYQRGYLGEATKILLRMRDRVGTDDFARWQTLTAATLLAQGRYNEASEVIAQGDDDKRMTPHLRYNLGVALINDGRLAEGRAWLDKVALLTPYDQEQLVLKDKANLLLGYHFLQNQQGGTAKPFFSRVRTEGPYSNRALLGLGWSELAPRGIQQKKIDPKTGESTVNAKAGGSLGVLLRPGFVDTDVTKRLGIRPFKFDKAPKDLQAAVENALVPWTELVTRDPMDPAVQEGLLAIPYAFDTLRVFDQSSQLYLKAVGVLETARKRIDIAIDSIRKGRMVETIVRRDLDSENGREWRLRDLPDAPETYYLQSLLAEHRFQESLKNYRDIRLIARNLDNWRPRLEALARNYGGQGQSKLDPKLMVAQALQGWAGYGLVRLALRSDDNMAAPGTYDERLKTDAEGPALLWPAQPPERFDGSREKVLALVARLEELRPRVLNIAADQNLYLQTMSIKELEGQRTQIDRYLVQARFAVARINDRQGR